jgi:hypothetical protein
MSRHRPLGIYFADKFIVVADYFVHYNYVHLHCTLRIAPAMVAGISDRLGTLEELAE